MCSLLEPKPTEISHRAGMEKSALVPAFFSRSHFTVARGSCQSLGAVRGTGFGSGQQENWVKLCLPRTPLDNTKWQLFFQKVQ